MASAISRRLGFDTNPLRRRSDRVQTVARVVAALVLFIGCVGGAVTGLASYREERNVERLDETLGYHAQGRVLSERVNDVGVNGPTKKTYQVAWEDEEGRQRVHTFDTSLLKAVPKTVTVYVGARGDVSLSPRTRGRMIAAAIFDGIATVIQVFVALAVAYCVFLLLLGRRRKLAWAKEWAAVEPRWRRQVL